MQGTVIWVERKVVVVVVVALPSHVKVCGGGSMDHCPPAFFYDQLAHTNSTLCQNQSRVAQRAAAIVNERSLTSCV